MSPMSAPTFRDAISSFPEQLVDVALDAGDVLRAAASVHDIDSVVLSGMGGSGCAAEIAATGALAHSHRAIPIVVVHDYELPAWVTPRTVVIAVSHSGQTEETLSAFAAARQKGARVATVTSGGQLASFAAADPSIVHVPVPGGTMPRAALGSLTAACVALLEGLGLYPGGLDDVLNAGQALAWRRDEMAGASSTVHVAAELAAARTPIIHGGDPAGHVAATRWKADFNENAKVPAFAATLPEANHNELCAWEPNDRRYCAVLLRHAYEHARVGRRFAAMRPILADSAFAVVEVFGTGSGLLAQLLDLAYQGTWASLFVADSLGVDPEPIRAIERLKRELSAPDPGEREGARARAPELAER